MKGTDFRHKNWGRVLVAAGKSSCTAPFMAQEFLSAGLQGMLEIEERHCVVVALGP